MPSSTRLDIRLSDLFNTICLYVQKNSSSHIDAELLSRTALVEVIHAFIK